MLLWIFVHRFFFKNRFSIFLDIRPSWKELKILKTSILIVNVIVMLCSVMLNIHIWYAIFVQMIHQNRRRGKKHQTGHRLMNNIHYRIQLRTAHYSTDWLTVITKLCACSLGQRTWKNTYCVTSRLIYPYFKGHTLETNGITTNRQ